VSRELTRISEFMMKRKIKQIGGNRSMLFRRREADIAMRAVMRMPRGAVAERVDMAGMCALRVRGECVPADAKTLLYFHGGAFYSGSAETHKGLVASISAAARMQALVVDYRLAPEHLYPAAHEDALAAWQWLLESGVAPGDIALGGDSAGGNLVLSTLLSLRDRGSAPPRAAVMLSPWLDPLEMRGGSYQSRAALDPSLDAEGLLADARMYYEPAGGYEAAHLLDRDMAGLPPMLVQAGDREVLLDDSVLLAERARAAGVDVTLEVWPECWHVFQALVAFVPEAAQAVERIGAFLREKMG
jgi:monoterpene epsilon-lactone hydrolase